MRPKTHFLFGLLVIWAIFSIYIQSYILDDTSNPFIFSTFKPRNVHLTKSDNLTTFTWSVNSCPEYCTLSINTQKFHILKYSSYLYKTYIFKVSIPNQITSSSPHYTISCTQDDQSETRFFPLNTSESFQKLLLLGDYSTSKIGDPSNKLHTQIYKPNIHKYLLKDISTVDSVWHLGDIAYDLNSNDGGRAFEFLSDIEQYASSKPYYTTMGNHELVNKLKDYSALFADPPYYKRTLKHVTVFAVNSEFDIYSMKKKMFPYNFATLMYLKEKQLKWLKLELGKIDRKKLPWVVVLTHTPLYCSKNPKSGMINEVCGLQAGITRKTFEDIFLEYQVDLGVFGHVHLYERTLPLRKGKVSGRVGDKHVFVDPQAPVYVVNGVGGNIEEKNVAFFASDKPESWSVYMSENLGYGVLTIFNNSHLKYEQFGFGKGQWGDAFEDYYGSKRVEDYFWIIKNKF